MSRNLRLFFYALVTVALLLTVTNFALQKEDQFASLRAAIKAKGAAWEPGESWVARLSPEKRRHLLGENSHLAPAKAPAGQQEPQILTSYPPAIDWRNKDGANWVTSVKDQQDCGSCVAFAACATLESLVRIELIQPDRPIDLSEMHLFDCGGGLCVDQPPVPGGWTNDAACNYLMNNGTPDEECWPYQDQQRPCSETCSNWTFRVARIANSGQISGIEALKTNVAIAPVLVAFDVYEDFYNYHNGIYEHVSGAFVGGHAVCIVGYDTTGPKPYWICKNSWADTWGEAGYFRIKMGECNI